MLTKQYVHCNAPWFQSSHLSNLTLISLHGYYSGDGCHNRGIYIKPTDDLPYSETLHTFLSIIEKFVE